MTTVGTVSGDEPRRRRWAGPLAIASVGIAMLVWTWGTWPDPVVDFGRELYVPWRLSEGDVLYRDVAHFNGPLSQYFNALLFKLAGPGLWQLVVVNLAILSALVAMVYRLWAFIADTFTAVVACIVLLTVFAFLRLSVIGNYNFLTPYSHELTHGLVMSFAGLCCLHQYLRIGRTRWVAVTGGLLGLIFLTKVEVFVAAATALTAGMLLTLRIRANDVRPVVTVILVYALTALAAPVLAVALLSTAMPLPDALRGAGGSIVYAMDPDISTMPFYRRVTGTLELRESLKMMAVQFGGYCLIAAGAGVFAFMLQVPRGLRRWTTTTIAFIASALAMARLFWIESQWEQAFRGFPAVVLLITVALIVLIVRERRRIAPRRVMQVAVALFALLLTAKVALNLRTQHYGFALAMPATLVILASALSWVGTWLPKWLHEQSNRREVSVTLPWRALMLPVVGLFVFVHLRAYAKFFADLPVVVAGTDWFRAESRGDAVNQVVQALEGLHLSSSLAVVPEGAMINFLARRRNPTGYINLMPPEVAMFGEQRIVEAFEARPPDFVLLVQSDTRDYGYRSFQEYAGQIQSHIEQHYTPALDLTHPSLPMRLMKRKPQ
jgi:hypothetical protein